MKDPDDHDTIDDLSQELGYTMYDQSTYLKYKIDAITSFVRGILNKVFYGLIGITMFLCFFSLSASMSANLYE